MMRFQSAAATRLAMHLPSVVAATVAAGALFAAPLEAQSCPGDCNDNGAVAINELITGVNIVLGRANLEVCPSIDVNENGTVAINELISAVNASLGGCGGGATFDDVQAIFTEKCATVVGCHVGAFPANEMSLAAGESYDEIVGIEPSNLNAVNMGFLRVDPGNASNSFLLLKVAGPVSPELGTQMPQFQPPLSEDEVRTIREWIDAGANP